MKRGYIGTYSGDKSKGIYQFQIDEEGRLSDASLFAEINNSKYIGLTNTHLYSVYDDEEGSGCRHGVVSRDYKYLYVIGELSNKVYAVNLNTCAIVSERSVLPNNEENQEGSAAIRLSKDGRKLYVSTRDRNIITVLEINGEELKVVSTFSAEGDHPRDILNIENDKYLLVANRLSNELCSFDMSAANKLVNKIDIPEGVSIVLKVEE